LDDFISRLDITTGKRILLNIQKNYPDLTLISSGQKIDETIPYDLVVLLINGEFVASGSHNFLMNSNEEYKRLFNFQKSTRNYEL